MKITNDYVFFFTGKDIYSNFYSFKFIHHGQAFQWAEQAIMWRKAKLFGAERIAQEILQAKTPLDCKKLGRSREIKFVDSVWEEQKLSIFKQVLYDKFRNEPLLTKILNTENKRFVEASPYDKIWGVGLAEDDPKILDESNWKGQNLLGHCLDEVKFELNKRYGQRY